MRCVRVVARCAQAVKAAGLCRQQGKNYVMQDGDIVFFNVNTAGIAKKK